ncbi:hypothetical protein RDI58_021737 [Solanum bulbocastanum]|uniref:Uncharacterized protein n=1 Tax=Solanum bulbocastanum TaxID=147425 RepID=A0AAN8T0V8_SOLBU
MRKKKNRAPSCRHTLHQQPFITHQPTLFFSTRKKYNL